MEGLTCRGGARLDARAGFELAGLDLRVMGVDELLEELRDQIRALERQHRMDGATDELRRRLDAILTASRRRCASDTAASRSA